MSKSSKYSRKIIFNLFYFLIWGVPFIFFCKDFFHWDIFNLKNIPLNFVFNSLTQGMLTVIISFFISLAPAYYSAYRRDRVAKILDKIFFIPFIFPSIAAVIAFTLIFNTRLLKNLGISYSLAAIIIANCFYNSPIFIRYISEGLRSIPKEIEEAAAIDGVGEISIFFRMKLPLIMPQIFKGGFLVFLYSFTSFVIVIALGGLQYSTLETEIATTLTGSMDFSKAITLGVFQSSLLILFNFFASKIDEYELKGEFYERRISPILRWISCLYVGFQLTVFLIPTIFSFINIYTGVFSISHYLTIFTQEFNEIFPVVTGIRNSLILSAIGSFVVIILSYLMIKSYSRFTELMLFGTFGISSGFLGIALIYLNITFNIPLFLLLIQGYILITLPLGYSFLYQYIKKFDVEIIEASLIDGANFWERLWYIEIPILKRIFLGVYLQIFAILFGEFTIAYTMQLGNVFPILPLVNYSLISSKKFLESSALNSLSIFLLTTLFFISEKILEDKKY